MMQLKFLIEDIRGSLPQFLFGLVQIVVAMLLLCYIFQQATVFSDTMAKLRELSGGGEIYHIRMLAEDSQISAVLDDESRRGELGEFMAYVDSYPVRKFIVNDSVSIGFSQAHKPFDRIGDRDDESGMTFITPVFASPNFFEVFRVSGDFDSKRVREIFESCAAGDDAPAVLGADFRPYYKAGDIFEDDRGTRYRVAGFLDKGSFFVAPYESAKAHYLDGTFIAPIASLEPNFTTLISTCFVTDDTSALDEIVSRSKEMGLLPLGYDSFSYQAENSRRRMLNEIMTMATVMGLVFLFALIGMVTYFIRFIQSRLREFSVLMLCGAREGEIIGRIAMQISAILLVSIIAALAVFGLSASVLYTALVGGAYSACVLAYPVLVFKRTPIVRILRSNSR
ncbi:MAG: hypothetical protein LBG82_09095 [Clostridiales Family XIII bacterium]|nr:hypothetical protein [Clostridiales Family XIII bacterium]